MRETAQGKAQKQTAIDYLKTTLKPGDRIYGIVRSVSRSGMSQTIDFYFFNCEDSVDARGCREPYHAYLSGSIAAALALPRTDRGALKVRGCGLHHVVHHLSWVLFQEGSALKAETL